MREYTCLYCGELFFVSVHQYDDLEKWCPKCGSNWTEEI